MVPCASCLKYSVLNRLEEELLSRIQLLEKRFSDLEENHNDLLSIVQACSSLLYFEVTRILLPFLTAHCVQIPAGQSLRHHGEQTITKIFYHYRRRNAQRPLSSRGLQNKHVSEGAFQATAIHPRKASSTKLSVRYWTPNMRGQGLAEIRLPMVWLSTRKHTRLRWQVVTRMMRSMFGFSGRYTVLGMFKA